MGATVAPVGWAAGMTVWCVVGNCGTEGWHTAPGRIAEVFPDGYLGVVFPTNPGTVVRTGPRDVFGSASQAERIARYRQGRVTLAKSLPVTCHGCGFRKIWPGGTCRTCGWHYPKS